MTPHPHHQNKNTVLIHMCLGTYCPKPPITLCIPQKLGSDTLGEKPRGSYYTTFLQNDSGVFL